MKKMLIAYFSWSNGNTEGIARMLKAQTGSDLVRIETAVPYSGSYDEVVEQGKAEVERGFQPQIKPVPVDVQACDMIAVGTHTWWYTMAPAVLSFLRQQDWRGKTVVPFQTHAGWPGHVIQDIRAACEGAAFGPAMEVKFDSDGGSRMETPVQEIGDWIIQVKNLLKS